MEIETLEKSLQEQQKIIDAKGNKRNHSEHAPDVSDNRMSGTTSDSYRPASMMAGMDCSDIIGILAATITEACDGMAIGAMSALLGGADPAMLVSDLCMATCGTCVAGTEGSEVVAGGAENSPVLPVIETVSTATVGKDGYSTYQLALELNPELAGNVYAIYAAEGGEDATPPLSFPPALPS